jgi:hypothetical protein
MNIKQFQKYQYITGIVIVLIIMIIIEYISISRVSKVVNDMSIVINSLIPCIEITDNILDYYNRASRSIRNLLITSNNNEINRNKDYIKKTRIELQAEFDKLDKTKGIVNKYLFIKIKDDYNKIRQLEDKIIELGLERKISEADKLLTNDLRNIQNIFLNEIQSFIGYQVNAADDLRNRIIKENNRNYYFMAILSIMAILLIISIIINLFYRQRKIRIEREDMLSKLDEAHKKVNVFTRFLAICDNCQKIKDDNGVWHSVETFFKEHQKLESNHVLCPECAKKLYPPQ